MVIALDKNKRPAGFLTEKRCRKLFEQKRAVRYRMFPMVVILKDIDVRTFTQTLPEYRLKIDPGAKYDGFAIIDPVRDTVVFTLQVEHRAGQVKQNLDARRQARRNRRSRETVYRCWTIPLSKGKNTSRAPCRGQRSGNISWIGTSIPASTVAGYLETRCWNGSISVPVPVEAVTASKMQLLPVTDVTRTKDL